VPILDRAALERLSSTNAYASDLYSQFADSIIAGYPTGLGLPSHLNQSTYYPGIPISREEITTVNKVLDKNSIYAENTRIRKTIVNDRVVLEVLQASADLHYEAQILKETDSMIIRLHHGDHFEEILRICKCLREAKRYTANAFKSR
jgi:dipeptidyl-peptidase-3